MTETPNESSRGWLRRLPLIAVVAVAAIGAFTLRDQLSFSMLSEHAGALEAWRDGNYFLTLAVFWVAYVGVVAFSLPGATIMTLAGGLLFGTFPGALYNITAATVGAMGIFLAARMGLGEQLAARMEGSEGAVRKIKHGIDENQWEMLFLIRLVPVVPFFVANVVPALLGVPLGRYVITTFLGIIPGGVVYTAVGAGLGEVIARGETPNLGVIFEPHILLPILGLAALAALPIVLKRFRSVKGKI